MSSISIGYTLSSEEHEPADLVKNAEKAEQVGFDFLSISDHYFPWVSTQGQSAFVWTVLGVISQATKTILILTGVTCPIMRIHPAIVAIGLSEAREAGAKVPQKSKDEQGK